MKFYFSIKLINTCLQVVVWGLKDITRGDMSTEICKENALDEVWENIRKQEKIAD